MTAATGAFTVAGMLEPTYEVGGDVFDFALSAHTVSVAIFDAVGHGLPAGLMACTALAGYRSARRDGQGVYAQGRAIDDALAAGGFEGHLRHRDPRRAGRRIGPVPLRQRGHPRRCSYATPGWCGNSARDGDCPSAWRRRA